MREIQGYRPAKAFIGDSPAIHRINEQIRKAALTEVPILITGEGGTGKELAARLLHDLSARRAHSFFKVNCPAIPKHIFENELFGNKADASAETTESGYRKRELGDRGTLFLDEITELDPTLQPKLLHALQEFRVLSVGGGNERPIDIRLICATSRDIDVQVKKGIFRADLFHRINVLRIQMPSLCERSSDVPILMNHFIKMYAERFGVAPEPLRPSFMRYLQSYHWPGNIRELENLAKRYVVMGGEEHLLSALTEHKEIRPLRSDVMDMTTPLRAHTKRFGPIS